MKNQFFLLTVCIALFGASSCSEEDGDNDVATEISGTYTNTVTNTTIVVNRINDTKVSMAVTSTNSELGDYAVTFTDVEVISATDLVMNSVTLDEAVCGGTRMYFGTGGTLNDRITIQMTVVFNEGSCDDTYQLSESATKQ